jgi:hypothetical protein
VADSVGKQSAVEYNDGVCVRKPRGAFAREGQHELVCRLGIFPYGGKEKVQGPELRSRHIGFRLSGNGEM